MHPSKTTVQIRFLLATLSLVVGCSPVYQMSREGADNEIPALSGSFVDVLSSQKRRINRVQVFDEALKPYGLSVEKMTKDDFPDCTPMPAAAAAIPAPPRSGCLLTSTDPKAQQISRPVAAIISAATRECAFWTYRQDTSAINQGTIATAFGTAAVVGGVLAGIGSSKTAAASVAAAGAVTAAANYEKAPSLVSSIPHNVTQEGLSYYPLWQIRISSPPFQTAVGDNRKAQIVSVLSELWDVAGSACPGGVLKGASWFNGYAN